MSNAKTRPAAETLYQAEAHGAGMLSTTWRYNRGHGVTRETIGTLIREWMARDIGRGGRPFQTIKITLRGEIVALAHRATDGEWYTTQGRVAGIRTVDEKFPVDPAERVAAQAALAAWKAAGGSEAERMAVAQAAYDAAKAA